MELGRKPDKRNGNIKLAKSQMRRCKRAPCHRINTKTTVKKAIAIINSINPVSRLIMFVKAEKTPNESKPQLLPVISNLFDKLIYFSEGLRCWRKKDYKTSSISI